MVEEAAVEHGLVECVSGRQDVDRIVTPTGRPMDKPSDIRVACLGHDVYFENHYCEKSAERLNVEWFSFDHHSRHFYEQVRGFRPDITLIFRPELHARSELAAIPGIKIGYSTEPIPRIVNGEILRSSETERRMQVLKGLDIEAYNAVFHYDSNSRTFCDAIGWKFADYGPIPINTDWFNPFNKPEPNWDVVFVGKATPRRVEALLPLKSHNCSFLWIEHGLCGRALAEVFRRARCVLNIHADHLTSLEPRVYLAAACGVPVLSDDFGDCIFPMRKFVRNADLSTVTLEMIFDCIATVQTAAVRLPAEQLRGELRKISTAEFIRNLICRYV